MEPIRGIRSRRRLDGLLLSVIIVLYGVNTYLQTSIDSAPPQWDESVHLRDSLIFYSVLTNPSQLSLEIIKEIVNKSDRYPLLRPSGYYPPLVPVVTALLYAVFGTSATTAVMSNLIFIAVLVFSVYATGSILFDRAVGLLAAWILLLLPIILEHSLIYYLDLPLTAALVLTVLCILKSDFFESTKFSFLAGLCFGLAMLTKWTSVFFVLGPFGYMALGAVFPSLYRRKAPPKPPRITRPLSNLALLVIVSILTFGPYYFPIFDELVQETVKFSSNDDSPASLTSFASLSFYPVALWTDMVTPVGVVLFLIGIALLLRSKQSWKVFLLVWLLVPYAVFTFVIQNKQPRYMMPWLVPVCLTIAFAAVEIGTLKGFALKRVTAPLCLALFFALFLRSNASLRKAIEESSRNDWKLDQIVSTIEQDMFESHEAQTGQLPPYFGVIPDQPYLNGQTIRYYATVRRLPVNVIKLQTYDENGVKDFFSKFDRYDYILSSTDRNGSQLPMTSQQRSRAEQDMTAFFYDHIERFERLRAFSQPNGSEVAIFRKRL